jgi:phosphoglycerate dehydrogenase-like enzyme
MILIDPQPRTMDLIFQPAAQRRLAEIADLVVFDTGPMPTEMLERNLPQADLLIGQTDLPTERLQQASKLRAIFNVEGNFLPNIDYDHCFSHGIRVLIASPAFALPVAEMALAFALDLARGISKNDRAFRSKAEIYGLRSNQNSFLFTGCRVGIIGFGDLARAFRPMLRPFRCPVKVYAAAGLPAGSTGRGAVFLGCRVRIRQRDHRKSGVSWCARVCADSPGRTFCLDEQGWSSRF